MEYHDQWEEVAKTENAHKAIACHNFQNEHFYNMSGIISASKMLARVQNMYGEKCAELTVLEVGCGTGRETRYLADCFKEILAVDVSISMITKGMERVKNGNIKWINNENGILPVADESVDIVYSFIVFQHCKSDTVKKYFAEASRVLKKGGRFIFQLGTGNENYEPVNYGDMGRQTVETLRQNLADAGFEVEELSPEHIGLHIAIKK